MKPVEQGGRTDNRDKPAVSNSSGPSEHRQ